MNQQEFSAVTPEFERLAKLCESHDVIDPELYTKYQVKRGLRDLDGKGVLTGLTEISTIISSEEGNGVTMHSVKRDTRAYAISNLIGTQACKKADRSS